MAVLLSWLQQHDGLPTPPYTAPAIPSCPPSLDFQPLGAANSKFFRSPHKPSLPPLSHHLAGSAVKKTDATSALFMTLIPKPARRAPGEGLGTEEAGGRHCPPGPDSHRLLLSVTRLSQCGQPTGQLQVSSHGPSEVVGGGAIPSQGSGG